MSKLLYILFTASAFSGMILLSSEEWLAGHSMTLRLILGPWGVKAFVAGGFAILQSIYTKYRLMQPMRKKKRNELAYYIRRNLTLFPVELYGYSLIFVLTGFLLFHISGFVWLRIWNRSGVLELIRKMAFDSMIIIGLALVQFIIVRTMMRRMLQKTDAPSFEFPQERTQTYMPAMFISTISAYIILIGGFGWMDVKMWLGEQRFRFDQLFIVSASTLVFGILVFLAYAIGFRNELLAVIQGMHRLLDGSREHMRQKMPVLTSDEIGQLTAIFNQIQDRVTKKFAKLEEELALAASIHQKLLPQSSMKFGKYEVCFYSRTSKELGGDLIDLIPVDGVRFAAAIGDVSGKGISAALIMSSLLIMLRTEIKRGAEPVTAAANLNRILTKVLKQTGFVTLALVTIDPEENTISLLSAGHTDPYVRSAGGVRPIPVSSLPMGIDEHVEYKAEAIELNPSEELWLYTDGTVEAWDQDGEFFGFERFEQLLDDLPQGLPAPSLLETCVKRLPGASRNKYEDDVTILLIRRSNGL